MGILAYVARTPALGDSTANGISSKYSVICVGNTEGPFQPTEKTPELFLAVGFQNSIKLITKREMETGQVGMFGGNFAHSSDSRFNDKIKELTGQRLYGAVCIHDRFED